MNTLCKYFARIVKSYYLKAISLRLLKFNLIINIDYSERYSSKWPIEHIINFINIDRSVSYYTHIH